MADRAQREVVQRRLPYPQQVFEFGNGVRTVVPEVTVRMCATHRAGIPIGHVSKPGIQRLSENLLAGGVSIDIVAEVLVGIQHRAYVPGSDLVVVGLAEIERSVIANAYQRKRIVHDRCPVLGAGREIVFEAQRVADFVRRQLANPRQRHFQHVGRHVDIVVRCKQPFGDQVILSHTQRTERHVAFQNFAGAGIQN